MLLFTRLIIRLYHLDVNEFIVKHKPEEHASLLKELLLVLDSLLICTVDKEAL